MPKTRLIAIFSKELTKLKLNEVKFSVVKRLFTKENIQISNNHMADFQLK